MGDKPQPLAVNVSKAKEAKSRGAWGSLVASVRAQWPVGLE